MPTENGRPCRAQTVAPVRDESRGNARANYRMPAHVIIVEKTVALPPDSVVNRLLPFALCQRMAIQPQILT